VTRVSGYNPQDSEQNGVVLGSTDIATTHDDKFLYQLREFSVPDGTIPLVPRIVVRRVTKNREVNAGLSEVESVPLPADLAGSGVMGLAIAQ
jgi:hypothetical protein